MPRFSIIATVDYPDEVKALKDWLAKWQNKVAYISDNQGCGCCIDHYDVDGSEEAMKDLPAQMQAATEWSQRPA